MKQTRLECASFDPGTMLSEMVRRKHIASSSAHLSTDATLISKCPECHAEKEEHNLKKTNDMHFICKKCRRAFRKDMTQYEESDEYCPHCDNHYVSRRVY